MRSPLASRLLPLALLLMARPAAAQYFGLELGQDSARVGEIVTLHMKVHIGNQQNLADRVPSLVGPIPDGVRLVSMDTLSVKRTLEGAVLEGNVRFAFYRPGIQDIPPMRLILRPIASDRGQVMEPEPRSIRIVSVLPEGNPSLKDIRDEWPRQPVNPWLVVLGVAGAGVAVWAVRRLLARRVPRPAAPLSPRPVASGPLAQALAELDALSKRRLYETDVTAHYDAVAEILRRYFIEVAPATTRAQTSTEMLRALSRMSSNGAWHTTRDVLGGADLVKFAGEKPGAVEASRWTDRAREALTAWSSTLGGGTS